MIHLKNAIKNDDGMFKAIYCDSFLYQDFFEKIAALHPNNNHILSEVLDIEGTLCDRRDEYDVVVYVLLSDNFEVDDAVVCGVDDLFSYDINYQDIIFPDQVKINKDKIMEFINEM